MEEQLLTDFNNVKINDENKVADKEDLLMKQLLTCWQMDLWLTV